MSSDDGVYHATQEGRIIDEFELRQAVYAGISGPAGQTPLGQAIYDELLESMPDEFDAADVEHAIDTLVNDLREIANAILENRMPSSGL
jgi:hypothetical protein